ncbi:hypothetical protein ACFFQW_45180 [Umezawaea endophytica]|uniref:Uncharacterized protein n=1 Tax=Umezawaea endophytica TaxID=1654476 RepID=A0A9X2VXS1_9PSEU|nr:hypothetical protein [Umezawaea endophytica]MCS7484655.1 hypothetical protein [Umezawaea endophytica]
MPAFERVEIDRDGVAELLASAEFGAVIQGVADEVAGIARSGSHRVASGEPLPVDVFDDPNRDRVGVTVAVRHPAGVGMEARHGVLKRAAEAAGLTVAGLEVNKA